MASTHFCAFVHFGQILPFGISSIQVERETFSLDFDLISTDTFNPELLSHLTFNDWIVFGLD